MLDEALSLTLQKLLFGPLGINQSYKNTTCEHLILGFKMNVIEDVDARSEVYSAKAWKPRPCVREAVLLIPWLEGCHG
jgi:hypothetical protein